jgi:hypothetical protein
LQRDEFALDAAELFGGEKGLGIVILALLSKQSRYATLTAVEQTHFAYLATAPSKNT